MATERYQRIGWREDTFAEKTERFNTLDQAIRCLLIDCCCECPEDPGQDTLLRAADGNV